MAYSKSTDKELDKRLPGKLKREKLLRTTDINSSSCLLWEVKYYLKFNYDSYQSDQEMLGISAENLFEECMKFCYPKGFPKFYLSELFKIKQQQSFQYRCSVLYRHFISSEMNTWLKKELKLDYSKATDYDIKTQGQRLWDFFIEWEVMKRYDMIPAFRLAHRIHKLLIYLKKDQTKRCKEQAKCKADKSYDRDIKHEHIKGTFYQILTYVDIDVMYNGECQLDFICPVGEKLKEHCFKVKADAIGFTTRGPYSLDEELESEPFFVLEVFGGSSTPVIDKLQKCLSEYFLTNEECDDKVGSSLESVSEDTELSSDSNTCKVQDVSEAIASLKINKSDSAIFISESNVGEQIIEDNFQKPIFPDYSDNEIIKHLHNQITSCGPTSCSTGKEADKFYGQLALQLYGALLQKKASRSQQKKCLSEESVFGIFAVNEFVYLAKISGFLGDAYEPNTVKLTYAKNVWFNIYKPNDRLALICFLYHLNRIHTNQAKQYWSD